MVRSEENEIVGLYCGSRFISLREATGKEPDALPVYAATPTGNKILVRSCLMLLATATDEICKGGEVEVFYPLSKGLYGLIHGISEMTEELIERIQKKMNELVERKEPILVVQVRNSETVYKCGSICKAFVGPLVPHAGYVRAVKVLARGKGFVLEVPQTYCPTELAPAENVPGMVSLFTDVRKFYRTLDCRFVSDLNRHIRDGSVQTVIDKCEADVSERFETLANSIRNRLPIVRTVLIAGPTSSGKTTFGKRLAACLYEKGTNLLSLSLDDYFVNREDTPKNEDGSYDFESLQAVDVDLFNSQAERLLQGESVCLPHFDFITGKRYYDTKKTTLSRDGILIVEGLHALNDKLVRYVSRERQYKVSVGVWTQLPVDELNRISTSDTRIIRRLIRDNRTRGRSPEVTLEAWNGVRRGEDINIYPYRQDADALFDTSLVYEWAVMKPQAEILLATVGRDSPYYLEARRLCDMLTHFLPLSVEVVPKKSLLREFIGEEGTACESI